MGDQPSINATRTLTAKLKESMQPLDSKRKVEGVPHEEVLADFKQIYARQQARHAARFARCSSRLSRAISRCSSSRTSLGESRPLSESMGRRAKFTSSDGKLPRQNT